MPRSSSSPPATIAGAGFVALDLLLPGIQDLRVRRRAGGSCGNVLAILSFLGFHTVPILRLGTDEAADILVSDLQTVGVDCSHVQRDLTARTPRVVEFIPSGSGEAHRFAFRCPLCQRRFPRRSEPVCEQAIESLRYVDPQLFFFDRAGPNTVRLASEARKQGALVMFEPGSFKTNDHFMTALEISDIVKYSGRGVGQPMDPWLREIRAGPRLLVETLDGGGLRYRVRGGRGSGATWKHQRAFVVNGWADQAGAGDWCSAGIIARLIRNKAAHRWRENTISRALRFGQALAAASIRFKGPRGYLENASQTLVRRAAFSTLRLGRVPDWVVQDHETSAWPFGEDGSKEVCALCLEPIAGDDRTVGSSGRADLDTPS